MVLEHAEVALGAGQHHVVHGAGEDLPLGGHDRQLDGQAGLLDHLLGLLHGLFDRSDHVEGLLGQGVVLAVEDLLEPADGVVQAHVDAGIQQQEAPRHFFVLKEPIELKQDGKFVGAYPDTTFKITCNIDFEHPLIQKQSCSIEIKDDIFEHEISGARTFGFLHEVEYMKRYGLARGGSLDNAVVIDDNGILNPDGLRYKNEFVCCQGNKGMIKANLPGVIQVIVKASKIKKRSIETQYINDTYSQYGKSS